MENECEALPGVAYPGVRDNRSTLNTKTGYDELNMYCTCIAGDTGERNDGEAQLRRWVLYVAASR